MGSAQSFRSFLFSFVVFFIFSALLDGCKSRWFDRIVGCPVFLLAAPGCKDGEAHRVGPEFPVGLYVLGFLLHDVTSLSVFIARGSTVQVPAGTQDGVRPHPVYPLAHQVDPGVVLNPALCCLVNPGHHVFRPFGFVPFR